MAGETLAKLRESSEGKQTALVQFIEPLRASLERVDARIAELERERASNFVNLQAQVEGILKGQASLQAETAHLASALRPPSSRGRWGEIQLRRVVELAGMVDHCDFVEPRTGEGNAASQPNLIVQLPYQRQIVVDAQVSLSAYLASAELDGEEARIAKRREYAAQVRSHVEQLSDKEYWVRFPQSPEFVIAFLPGEAFFSTALEFDPSLLEFGA